MEDARTWIEETGLCLFLPRRQFASSIAPSFVEAVAGQRNPTPDPKQIALGEELLVRLERDGVAVRLNLLGLPGEQPDFVVASWVLPYVYALRGDRDWRRTPQLTGSRQVSQLAVQAYKLLEAGDSNIATLKHTLGREVTEAAVLRAITELWQQLRIIPVIDAPGHPAEWQLLRQRFQKAIAEGASTSQVTAISVLASIYLQAVIAATMEEVEVFLAPLTARSKVREVLRGLVATRQVHTISMGHAPHFYVAGTLPEFSVAPTYYASSSMAASTYFQHAREREEEAALEPVFQARTAVEVSVPVQVAAAQSEAPAAAAVPVAAVPAAQPHAPRVPAAPRKPSSPASQAAGRPQFSRPAAHSRDRKPAAASNRPTRRPASDSRSSSTSSTGARPSGHSRPSSSSRWATSGAKSSNGARSASHTTSSNGARSNGKVVARPSKPASSGRNGKPAAKPQQGSARPAAKSGTTVRKTTTARSGSPVRSGSSVRSEARSPRGDRKPALAASGKAGSGKRMAFAASSRPGAKKRG